MNPQELLTLAEKLVAGVISDDSGHYSDTELRKAVSCAYYAMFHTLCKCCADMLVGRDSEGELAKERWIQAYRALDHGQARKRCNNSKEIGKSPPEVQKFAELFVEMQHQRHEADYSPDATPPHSSVRQSIMEVRTAITQFQNVPDEHLRLFAVYLLTNIRQN